MVNLLPHVQTRAFVTLYRLLTDYKAIQLVSFSSIVSILAGLWKLPSTPKPPIGESHTPYVRQQQRRRVVIGIGVATIFITLITIWFHYSVPSEIGHITNPPINVEEFRPELERFVDSFALMLLFQAAYWILRSRISQPGQK